MYKITLFTRKNIIITSKTRFILETIALTVLA